jgi:S1-C subfamily serine protease
MKAGKIGPGMLVIETSVPPSPAYTAGIQGGDITISQE